MALALGEDRDQHVRAGHFLAAGRLHMDDGALDHALEPGGRFRILVPFRHQVVELGLDIGDEAALQFVDVDIAGAHDGGRVLILEQRQQQMLQRGVFVMAFVRQSERPVKRLFEAARKSWHYGLTLLSLVSRIAPGPPLPPYSHFFSITHCRGCWCLRAKSITCVTFVSATS